MIKTIIIEDEQKSSDILKNLIEQNYLDVYIVGTADSVQSGISLVRSITPELIFLDIMMPDGTGFDVLEKIGDLKFDVIFTTATDKFAIKAIKYSALDYLLKPIDTQELIRAVKKISERSKSRLGGAGEKNLKSLLENVKQNVSQFSKITLPTGHAYEVVLIKDIIRCEANDNYTNVYMTGGKKFLVSATLKHYEDLLPENEFIRVHHSHLININHMVRFIKDDGGYAVMGDGSQVEVSRRKREDFLDKLKEA